MATPTLKRTERKTCKAYFIPAGEVVDGITTSQTTWPDAVPVTNYTDYQFADIEELVEEILFTEEVRKVPRQTAPGYRNRTEKFLEGVNWTGTTATTNNFLKTLQFATPNVIVAGTAQAPAERNMLWFDGVLLIELTNSAGVIIDRIQTWARMFLQDTGAAAKAETSVLQVKWEQGESGNNTYLPAA